LANIHINSDNSTHLEPFSAKMADVLALFQKKVLKKQYHT